MPFLPFMPDVNAHLAAFKEAVWLSPHGEQATGPTFFSGNPQLPETAGIDQTPLQKSAIKALVSMRNSAEEMALVTQQTQAIARNSKIAAARAYEALLAYQRIYSRETIAAAKAAASESGVPGLGGAPVSLLQIKASSFLGDAYQQDAFGNTPSKAKLKEQKAVTASHTKTYKDRGGEDDDGGKGGKNKKSKKGKGGGKGGLGGDEEEVDLDSGWYLKNELEDSFAFCKKVSIDAAQMAKEVTTMNLKVQSAARAVAEALKLPGAPVPPPTPPVMLKPPRRPRDLPPFWLDVPFATSKGGDPYAISHGDRYANGSTLFEVPGFNPFEGEVPMQEDGMAVGYEFIKPKSEGGKLDPGIFFDPSASSPMGAMKGMLQEQGEKAAGLE